VKVLACSLVLLVSLVTANCGSGSSSPPQNSSTAQVRILQASGDLGNVDVQVNGTAIVTDLASGQTFPTQTTNYANVKAGSAHYQEFATGTASPALVDTHLTLSPNTFYTVITAGEQSSASLGTILLTDDHVAPAPGHLRLRFVNAASDVGPIDLYFASASSGFPTTPSVPALAFKSSTTYLSFSGTSVQLCANTAGVPPTSSGGIGGVIPSCLMSVTLQFQSPPQNSMTFLFLDPPIPPANSPPGSFSAPMLLKSIPF
jgi:Domain of unknown function (DUF4397)